MTSPQTLARWEVSCYLLSAKATVTRIPQAEIVATDYGGITSGHRQRLDYDEGLARRNLGPLNVRKGNIYEAINKFDTPPQNIKLTTAEGVWPARCAR